VVVVLVTISGVTVVTKSESEVPGLRRSQEQIRTRCPRILERRDRVRWIPRVCSRLLVWLLCPAAWLPLQAQVPVINGLVNAATGQSASSVPTVARGSLIAIYGSSLSVTTLQANGFPLPTQLGGTQVLFGTIPAPLLYVSPGQINAQVPFELPDVSAIDLVVQNGTAASTGLQVTLLAQDPGIFVAVKSSGSQITASNPVMPGDSLTIYATGLGAVLPVCPPGNQVRRIRRHSRLSHP